MLVGDSTDVNNWNTFFELPTYGNVFTSVYVIGNEIYLVGGSNITMRQSLFSDLKTSPGFDVVHVIDEVSCIVLIEDNTFSYCLNLIEVDFPVCTTISDRIEGVSYGAFEGCSSLATINFPQLTYAGNAAFYNQVPLTSVNLPLLETAGNYCFIGTQATSISLPSLTTAGDSAFSETTLETISLPSLTGAGQSCFYLSNSLTSVYLPSLIIAGYNCFSQTSATSIDLPAVETIDNDCFSISTSLTSISIPSCTALGSTVGDNNVFASIAGNTITLTVPAALMTCNGGNPDGDIQYLQANNTVTIITT